MLVNNKAMRKILLFIIILLLMMFSFPNNTIINDVIVYQYIEGELFLSVNGRDLYQKQIDLEDIKSNLYSENTSSITIKLKGNVSSILNKCDAKIIKKQKINNKNIVYVYSKQISGYTQCSKSNMQIVENGDNITVGIPIIAGGF